MTQEFRDKLVAEHMKEYGALDILVNKCVSAHDSNISELAATETRLPERQTDPASEPLQRFEADPVQGPRRH